MKLTTNVKRLAIQKMSIDAIPAGGGVADGIKFLSNPKGIAESFKAACEWSQEVIDAVRNAGEPNPWRDATDEDIAGEIMRQVDEKLRMRRL